LDLKSGMQSVIGDICNAQLLEKELLSFQPDFIFHLAAQSLVRRSYKMPVETFEVNVTGTANLLDAVTRLNKKCSVLIITTDKVYANNESGKPFSEEDKLGGDDPYSASKACAEMVVHSFTKSFFAANKFDAHQITIGSARAGNVIGGGDFSEDRLFPDIIRTILNDQPLKLRYPEAIRPWQHVLEPLGAYLLWGGRMYTDGPSLNGAINFGPDINDQLQVKEVVEMVIKEIGKGEWLRDEQSRLHEAGILRLNIDKAEKVLGWKPKLSAQKSIKACLDWYTKPMQEQREVTRQQIIQYMKHEN